MTDKAVCDRGYIWNPSNYECECDNSCYVGEYQIIKCRERLVDKLVKEFTEILKTQV